MNEYILSIDDCLDNDSTGGKLMKWKINRDGKAIYVKASSFVNENFMYESYAEVIASNLAKWLGYPSVEYSLCILHIGDMTCVGCESEDFCSDDEFVSIGDLMGQGLLPVLPMRCTSSYNILIDVLSKFLPDYKLYLDRTLVLDYLIANDDRHYGNFGVLRNKSQLKIPPIFDNGNSLFCHKHIEGVSYKPSLINLLHCKPFSPSFEVQRKLIDKGVYKQIMNLDAMLDNLLYEKVYCGMPKERAKFIKDLILERYSNIA